MPDTFSFRSPGPADRARRPALTPPPQALTSEVARRASFGSIRYAQCWEDADVLLAGLDVQPGDRCLAIASAGDHALALLTRHPAAVVAIDLSPAQLACLALRVAAYRALDHGALLELVGSRPSTRRRALYAACRPVLAPSARAFWDARLPLVDAGLGAAGRFERYLRLFRRWVLPAAQGPMTVERLFMPRPAAERVAFFDDVWDHWRWRLLFRLFFSRFVMGRLGRSPSFFAYAEGDVAARLQARVRHACTALAPAENPYLQWILTGRHRTALPLALRPESFGVIRANLDRLTWQVTSLEAFLATQPACSFDRFNLSNVFEYVASTHYHRLLDALVRAGRPGGRLAYWNLFADRQRPEAMADRLRPLPALADRLHARDRAFFYHRFVVEELC